jgi:hypothetical protein
MRWRLWLRYIVAYLLWVGFAVGSYIITDLVRQAAFAFAIIITQANPYVVRLFNNIFFVMVGLIWLVLVVWMESEFRHSVQHGSLSLTAAKTACALAAALWLAQWAYMRYTPDVQTQLNVTIRDSAALALLIGLSVVVLLQRTRKEATP